MLFRRRKKSTQESSDGISKKSKSVSKKLIKKKTQSSSTVIREYFWPSFDYVRWNRAQETAAPEEVIETSKTEEIGSITLVSTEHVIKPKAPAIDSKLKAKLSSVGI